MAEQDKQPAAEAGRPERRSRLDTVLAAIAALVCFFAATTLRDLGPRYLPQAPIPAPPVPASVEGRAAELTATVRDEQGRPLQDATVRVFAVREDRAYFAGEQRTDAAGEARFAGLPSGEAWVMAYGAERARASTRLALEPGPRAVDLVLRPAKVLEVLVVDDAERPIDGAEVAVATADPLPFVATTEGGGRARFDRLGATPYVVRASAPGFEDTVRTGIVPGPVPLRLRMDRLGALTVRVVDAEGQPADGATVLAAGTGLWPARSTTTDATGAARISGLRDGVYDLKARRGGAVSATALAVPVRRGEGKEVKLVLGPGRHVRLLVTDGDGEGAPPVKGASVVLVEHGLSAFPLHGRTGDDGSVTLGPIAPGYASASALAAGFVPRNAVEVDASATEARIPLLRGGAIVGEVVDDRGYPVPGATIEVVGADAEGMPIDETTAMSAFRDEQFERALPGPAPLIPAGELGVMPGPIPDLPRGDVSLPAASVRSGDPWVTRADGTFRAEPVTPGRVHAIVRHPEYVETLSEVVTLQPGGEAHVRVVMRQGGLLEGRVLEEDRKSVAGARVELAATTGSLERVTYSADDGTFAFAAVPDEVLVSVSRPESPGDVVARLVVEVPERDRKEIEVVLPKVREAVAIHVADDRGYPLDRVEVRVLSLDVAVPLRKTLFTDDGGDALLADAAGLPLRISLVRSGRAPRVEQVDAAPKELRLEMSGALKATGTVTGRGGRERLEGARITLFSPTGPRRATSDAEGAFTLGDLAPGQFRVTVSRDGFAPATLRVVIAGDPDRPTDLGRIDLFEAGEVAGEVVDQRGDPVAGARVARDRVPTYLPLGPLPPGVVTTDRDGRFQLGGLPEGTAVIEAYSADLGRAESQPVQVRAGRTTDRVRIALPGDGARQDPKGAGSLAVTLGEERRTVTVVSVPPGSEAEEAGIEPGDRLLSVNGVEVRSLEEARRRLTGPLSEDVVVLLARDGERGEARWLTRVRREKVRR
ncbi:carboxypeptidase regulatory-like domain-containing protein [Sorangium cellulosum]|uniref:carboxypeptidase regulatory-like domain-containing protein n=1 Tax=Sorangium cellulosum TaxID=56 RepID=UPI003D9A1208